MTRTMLGATVLAAAATIAIGLACPETALAAENRGNSETAKKQSGPRTLSDYNIQKE